MSKVCDPVDVSGRVRASNLVVLVRDCVTLCGVWVSAGILPHVGNPQVYEEVSG